MNSRLLELDFETHAVMFSFPFVVINSIIFILFLGDDVRRVAEDIFTRQPPAIAAMGALDDLPDYDRFLEWSNGNF
tara:strand:- start:517 stop:744 length:228 start_codon:yes stop_codon:yes gene_type:complete